MEPSEQDELPPVDYVNETPQPAVRPSSSMRWTALLFELGLGVAAVAIGWLVGWSPLDSLRDMGLLGWATSIAIGLVAAAPLLASLWLAAYVDWRPLRELQETTRRVIQPLFANATWTELALLSLAAGLGEELLFRGLVQDGVATYVGGPRGLVVGLFLGSFAFGLCHFVSPMYALLAMLAGVYLGLIFWLSGNLAAPITTHAIYDLVALAYYLNAGPFIAGDSAGTGASD